MGSFLLISRLHSQVHNERITYQQCQQCGWLGGGHSPAGLPPVQPCLPASGGAAAVPGLHSCQAAAALAAANVAEPPPPTPAVSDPTAGHVYQHNEWRPMLPEAAAGFGVWLDLGLGWG